MLSTKNTTKWYSNNPTVQVVLAIDIQLTTLIKYGF